MIQAQQQIFKLSKWKKITVYGSEDVKKYELDEKEKIIQKFPKLKPRKLLEEISQLKNDSIILENDYSPENVQKKMLENYQPIITKTTQNKSNDVNDSIVRCNCDDNSDNYTNVNDKSSIVPNIINTLSINNENFDPSNDEINNFVCKNSNNDSNQNSFNSYQEEYNSSQDDSYFEIQEFYDLD